MTETFEFKGELSWQQRATNWIQLIQNATSLFGLLDEFVTALPWRITGIYRVYEEENRIVPEMTKGYEAVGLQQVEFSLFPENNLISYCFSHRETILLRTQSHSHYALLLGEPARQMMSRLGVTVAVAIPLIHGGVVVGVLYLADDSESTLPNAAVQALESIAPILASMISKQQLLDRMEHENRILRTMQEMSQVLLFVRNETELWQKFREMLVHLGSVSGGVYLTKESEEWQVHDVFGILAPYRDRVGSDTILWVTKRLTDEWRGQRVTWTKPGVRVMPPYVEEESPSGRGLRYYLADNEVADTEQLIGVMVLYFATPDQSVERVLPALLQMFNLTLQIIRQRRKLEYLSSHDALTGLFNRRALEQDMEAYFQRSTDSPALLVLCDLDGFKQLNDLQGHQMGDAALRDIARYLDSHVPPTQKAYRFGGDEFVLFLKDRKWNAEYRERFTTEVQQSPIPKYGLSVTFGIVELPAESKDFTECYRLADERLYEGKRMGKNCIVGPNGIIEPFA